MSEHIWHVKDLLACFENPPPELMQEGGVTESQVMAYCRRRIRRLVAACQAQRAQDMAEEWRLWP